MGQLTPEQEMLMIEVERERTKNDSSVAMPPMTTIAPMPEASQ